MDVSEAKRIIRDQDLIAQQRLKPTLLTEAHQASAQANSLVRLVGKAWVPNPRMKIPEQKGTLEPRARKSIRSAYEWANSSLVFSQGIGKPAIPGMAGFTGYRRQFLQSYMAIMGGGIWGDIAGGGKVALYHTRATVDQSIERAISGLRSLAALLQGQPRVQLLMPIPRDPHPPRYEKLKKDVLGHLIAEDIAVQLENGRSLIRAPDHNSSAVLAFKSWTLRTSNILWKLPSDVERDFRSLADGVKACDSPYIADGTSLGIAYISLALIYLEEVYIRVPDYAEAAGQPKRAAKVSITGGTFYGSQIAEQIVNNNSAVAGIVQQGEPNIVAALQAIEAAIRKSQDLTEGQRKDLLDNVGYLAEAANVPPEKRNRGILKSVLAGLGAAATTVGELGAAMNAWMPVLHSLIP